ncbi:MAG: VOC family protein [Ignavibacteriales bacterium]|nr:VOC family protein [Ignavibacteriales bacterium]
MTKILQNHYVLAVHDLRVSSTFFEKLGFQIVSEPGGWIFLERDNCMVMLGKCLDALPPSKLGDHSYFGYLCVDNVDSYYEDLKGKGIKILSPIDTKPWEMREFSVASPEGHRITIGQWIEKTKT